MKRAITFFFLFVGLLGFGQDRFAKIQIEVIPVNDNVYMLKGGGGNIGITTGDDGVFMVDDQFAALSEKIQNAIKTITKQDVRFLINTHFHGDHTGGNINFEAAGATIVAHDNVRKRLAADERTAGSGLPVITFSDDATFYMNGNDIFVTHVHNAHTDGDALVYFAQSNVLHTGDTFFNGMYPFIDIKRGGSIDGDIAAAKKGLLLINDDTKIIPGHGSIATKEDYKNYLKMLEDIRDNVAKAISSGKSEDQIIKDESLTSAFYSDEEASKFFIKGTTIRQTVYRSLQNPPVQE